MRGLLEFLLGDLVAKSLVVGWVMRGRKRTRARRIWSEEMGERIEVITWVCRAPVATAAIGLDRAPQEAATARSGGERGELDEVIPETADRDSCIHGPSRDGPDSDWPTVVARNDTHVSTMEGGIDWSQIEIAPMNGDEIDVPITQENMCSVLGINDEPAHQKFISEAAMKASIADVDACASDIDEDLLVDVALPVPDHMPKEDHFWYDKEHPMIEEGSLFCSVNDFRMLMRTFATRGKFDIKIKYSDTTILLGHCKGNGWPWRITARTIEDGKTVRVNKIVKPHKCSSTAAVITNMAD
ncbi:hypothetical protein D1007_18820 [Hordeum vulgare]|nr:hypothetical protein D1007_18820 [Hordeum vulgare]